MSQNHDDPTEDPVYKAMIRAIEQAKEHNITPISVHVGPFGIPLIESADVPKGTIMLLQPKQSSLEARWDEELQRTVYVASFKSKRK